MNKSRPYKLEVCVVSLIQAIDAEQHGADRVEICSRLETEGMTPDVELVSSLCQNLHIPIRVMIRATETGFIAGAIELKEMIRSILLLKKLPIDGFVIGVIKEQRIDRDAMQLLMLSAHPLPITVHKAIDLSEDIKEDIFWLNQFSQIDTILTSGCAVEAVDGVQQILQMKAVFKGEIMAAGKIKPEVLPALHEKLGLQWYHGRAII